MISPRVDRLLENLSRAPQSSGGHEGEFLYAVERLVVSPSTGVFDPTCGLGVGTTIAAGQLVGTVGGQDVRSPFSGSLEGMLAFAGERVTTSQPIAWLRTSP